MFLLKFTPKWIIVNLFNLFIIDYDDVNNLYGYEKRFTQIHPKCWLNFVSIFVESSRLQIQYWSQSEFNNCCKRNACKPNMNKEMWEWDVTVTKLLRNVYSNLMWKKKNPKTPFSLHHSIEHKIYGCCLLDALLLLHIRMANKIQLVP